MLRNNQQVIGSSPIAGSNQSFLIKTAPFGRRRGRRVRYSLLWIVTVPALGEPTV
jgi:hypothetical protein